MKSFCLTLSLLCSFHLCTNAQSGYLDLSYSEDGIFTADLGGNGFDIVYNSTLQTDGKLLLTGISNGDFAIMRLLPDGTPDPLFGNDGLSLVDYAGNSDRSHAVVVQPDGRIVIAGETHHGLGALMGADVRHRDALDLGLHRHGTVSTGGRVIP